MGRYHGGYRQHTLASCQPTYGARLTGVCEGVRGVLGGGPAYIRSMSDRCVSVCVGGGGCQ